MMPHVVTGNNLSVQIIRTLPMLIGMMGLLAGLWMSLTRLGLPVSGLPSINHGPLMVGGFIGTLISLERAVALGRPWGYAAPWLSAISAILLLFSFPFPISATTLLLASIVLLIIFGTFLTRQLSDFMLVMATGALSWAVGNALLLTGRAIPDVVPWWSAFLILTIAGERIEMSRLRPCSAMGKRVIRCLLLVYVGCLSLSVVAFDAGIRLGGIALVGLCLWLIRYDIARFTIRSHGLPRYAAFSVLSGYVWLFVSGLFGILWGQTTAGLYYDAWIHAQFLGFVLVMIMAHAPIILPAIAGVRLTFSPLLYAPVILLHLSLAARIGADLMLSWTGRQWTGTLNVASVLLFVAVMAQSVIRAQRGAPDA